MTDWAIRLPLRSKWDTLADLVGNVRHLPDADDRAVALEPAANATAATGFGYHSTLTSSLPSAAAMLSTAALSAAISGSTMPPTGCGTSSTPSSYGSTSGHDRDLRMLMRDHRSPEAEWRRVALGYHPPHGAGKSALVSASTSTRAAKSGPTFGASRAIRPTSPGDGRKQDSRRIERPCRIRYPRSLPPSVRLRIGCFPTVGAGLMADRVFPAHVAVARRDLLDRVTADEPQGAWRGAHGWGGWGGLEADGTSMPPAPIAPSGSRLWTINGQPPAKSGFLRMRRTRTRNLRRAVEVQTARLRGGWVGARHPPRFPQSLGGCRLYHPGARVGMGQAAHRVQDPRATTMVKGTVDRNQPVAQRPHGTQENLKRALEKMDQHMNEDSACARARSG